MFRRLEGFVVRALTVVIIQDVVSLAVSARTIAMKAFFLLIWIN